MVKRKTTPDPFAASLAAVDMLRQSQWAWGAVDGPEVFKLRLELASSAITAPAKADIPVPGLPTLDGFLSFVAFRAALDGALKLHPDLSGELLWQWNAALRDPTYWIDFSLPLRTVTLGTVQIYDCSIGLPTVNGHTLVPAGAFFARGQDLVTYPEVVDSLPLRRRVAPPYPRPMSLANKLNIGSGKNKAMDNRVYYSLTDEFVFYFRGDQSGVERLLQFACEQRIGIGKKTTLGYGLLANYTITLATTQATLTQQILDKQILALCKTLPHDAIMMARARADYSLFGCNAFRLMNAVETMGAYRPPYWRKEAQTQVFEYGTTLIPRK